MKKGASPLFRYSNEELGINEVGGVDFRNDLKYGPYAPYDTFSITNSSTENVKLTFNGSQVHIIFPGQIMTYEDQEITSFRVENIGDGIIAAQEIEIAFQRSPYDADDYARSRANPLQRVLSAVTGGIL
jgi:hypothetical protein